nr:MAG TPA: hypothetical protein [Caudoviricetes sp.]
MKDFKNSKVLFSFASYMQLNLIIFTIRQVVLTVSICFFLFIRKIIKEGDYTFTFLITK